MIVARRTLAALIAAAALLFSALSPVAAAAPESGPVYRFADGSVVAGASAALSRHTSSVSFRLNTSDLPPNTVDTLWMVVFNAPENCSHGVAPFRCGEGDLLAFGGDGSAQDSVLWAAGRIVGPNGSANYAGSVKVGDTSGALWGPGLINPSGADIHLIVHSHGAPIQGLISEMLKTFGAGCSNVPPGTGTPGPNICWDPQFAVFETI
jgi:hypothetical protein